MCGIAGWWKYDKFTEEDSKVFENMSLTLKRRGPDESNTYIYNDIVLIQRRLAVIDLEHGKQPMERSVNNKKYILVYNGELYNANDVKDELISKGYRFSEKSDTEVVLMSYICWGNECVEHLNGIFAFAVYNTADNELFLARDRIGVKPLFYSKYGNGFIFGSEIKTILANPVIKPQITEEGLNELLFVGPARAQGQGIFKNIDELLPGEYLVLKKDKIIKKKYYELTAMPFEMTESETVDYLKTMLTDAVERQLISDVPLCCFLSGGLDSSVICAVAANKFKEKHKMLPTYSVDYTDNQKYFQKSVFQPNDDKEYIKLMSRSINSLHREVILDNTALASALYNAVDARDLPGMADIDSSLLLFCSYVKNDYTVALSGECADELFGGYPWYHNEQILFNDCFPWSTDLSVRRSIVKKGFLPHGEEHAYQRYSDTVNRTDKLSTDSKLNARIREMFRLNFYWFMQTLLDRKDRMSMYSGLEVRVPFCDYRLVDFAYNLPWELKNYKNREKGIIRYAMSDILPDEITWRKKSPYPKTQNPEYFNIVSRIVQNILDDKSSVINSFISKQGVTDIIQNPEQISSPWYGQLMKAPQILAYLIQMDYWFKKYNVEILI